MALEISAQFNRFVDFAMDARVKGKMSSIARIGDQIGGAGPLLGSTITTTKRDRLSALWRSSENQKANNDTRTLFRQTIIDIFGGESKIPQEVKDAMELKNFGCGKPLTARRILAVKAAIDNVSARIEPGITQAKANAAASKIYRDDDPERNAKIDKMISVMVTAAAGDKDVLEVAVANVSGVLVGGDGSLRTDEKIKAKMESLQATMSELKTAAKGNHGIIKAGKAFLKAMHGKDIPKGLISGMIRSVMKANIGAIKSMSASSSGMALHKAAMKMADITAQAMKKSGADVKLVGADEKDAGQNLAAELVIARCSDSTKRKIASAFTSDNAKTLLTLYVGVSDKTCTINNMSDGLKDHTAKAGADLMSSFHTLYTSVQSMMGVAPNQVKDIGTVKDPDYTTINGQEIMWSVGDRGMERAQKENAKFMKDAVGGEGPAADALRQLYGKFAGPEASGAGEWLKFSRNTTITGQLNRNVCIQCKKFASGNYKDTFFYGDITCPRDVNLPGGKKLAKDFATVRDQLASLVTNGAKQKYEDLSKVEQTKTHIIMALLTQESEIVVESGEFLNLAYDGKNAPCDYAGGNIKRSFTISVSENGVLNLKSEVTKDDIPYVGVYDADNKYHSFDTNPGTKVESSFNLFIRANEFERLANLDFSKYDDSIPNEFLNDPTVQNAHRDLPSHMGGDFGFDDNNIVLSSEFKMTLA